MKTEIIVEAALTILDSKLRREFQNDYDTRCAYAAFGICHSLGDVGLSAQIAGGNFAAFVVAQDGERASLQGYPPR